MDYEKIIFTIFARYNVSVDDGRATHSKRILPAGLYVVVADGKSYKVIVK